jgi:hypothetical protein
MSCKHCAHSYQLGGCVEHPEIDADAPYNDCPDYRTVHYGIERNMEEREGKDEN